MKNLKEAAPAEIDAIRRRAIRSLAMGRISQYDCDNITHKLDDLEGFIYNIEERSGNGDTE